MHQYKVCKRLLLCHCAGQIVGVVTFNGSPAKESDTVLPVKFTARPSSRLLEEVEGSHDAAILIAEVLLVRRTLAWITGIILLIATLMGVNFLDYLSMHSFSYSFIFKLSQAVDIPFHDQKT